MSIEEYTDFLVKSIVTDSDLIKVSSFEGDENTTMLEVLVPEKYMGAVIGRNGKMASSLRILIQAYAFTQRLGRIRINIDSF